ncbi:MAG TPA: hypothetical protein VNO50_07675 [Pyrinomonadaceae bacterium]|nr:hypothetical protein [Pyrinomonadaceae bacterium]
MLAKFRISVAATVAISVAAVLIASRVGIATPDVNTIRGRIGEPITLGDGITLTVSKSARPPYDVAIPAPLFQPANNGQPINIMLEFSARPKTELAFVLNTDPKNSDISLRVVDGLVVSPENVILAGRQRTASSVAVEARSTEFRTSLKGDDYILLLFGVRMKSLLLDKDIYLNLQVNGSRKRLLVNVDRNKIK